MAVYLATGNGVSTFMDAVKNAKRNRQQCAFLGERVSVVWSSFEALSDSVREDERAGAQLAAFRSVLESAAALVEEFAAKGKILRAFLNGTYKSKFAEVNEWLDQCLFGGVVLSRGGRGRRAEATREGEARGRGAPQEGRGDG